MKTETEKLKSLDNIVEVKEVSTIKDANLHIKLGWKLIDTYKTKTELGIEVISYCLGWPKSSGKIVYSSNKLESRKSAKFLYSI